MTDDDLNTTERTEEARGPEAVRAARARLADVLRELAKHVEEGENIRGIEHRETVDREPIGLARRAGRPPKMTSRTMRIEITYE